MSGGRSRRFGKGKLRSDSGLKSSACGISSFSERRVLSLIVVISSVCALLVATDRIGLAGTVMWGLLIVVVPVVMIFEGREWGGALVIAVAPMVNLLRNVFLYNGVPLMLVLVAVFLLCLLPAAKYERSRWTCIVVLGFGCGFYAWSVLATMNWRSEIRVFELVGAVSIVVLIANRPRLLRVALQGMVITAISVGIAAYPHIRDFNEMRLGMIRVGDMTIGNPFAMGMPLALGLLLIVLDGGRWLRTGARTKFRYSLAIPLAALLALSASRASWLVFVGGILSSLLLGHRERFKIIGYSLALLVAGLLLINSNYGESFRLGWERTFGESETFESATSGRSSHWKVFALAITETPKTFLFGHGGGIEQESAIMYRYTGTSRHVFHGMIMHIGMQLGVLGICIWGVSLGVVSYFALVTWRRFGLTVPITCVCTFILLSLTASGFDSISGIIIGLALVRPARPPISRGALVGIVSRDYVRPKL